MEKSFETVRKLVNEQLNQTLADWSQVEGAQDFLIRHCGDSEYMIELQPTYSNVFHGIEDYIHIAEDYGCTFYVDVQKNLVGVDTPTLHIY